MSAKQTRLFGTTVTALTLLLGAGGAQASLLVLPNANAAIGGNVTTLALLGFGSDEVLFQWDIAGSQFGSVPVGSSITAIGFRLASGGTPGPPSPLNVGTFDLQLSTSLHPLGALSTNEASNIGPDAVTVLSGPLTIPANAFAGGPTPHPFYSINFSTAYTYEGGDLLFSLHSVNSGTLDLDAHNVDSKGDTVGYRKSSGSSLAEFYNYPITQIQFSGATSAPEPGSMWMLGAGLVLLVGRRLRGNRNL